MAEGAALLVLGSRGLSRFGGFWAGSVGLTVVARAELPVVLVRGPEPDGDGLPQDPNGTRYRPVLLGLAANSPDDKLIAFAFDGAAVVEESQHGSAVNHLVEAARDASLLVVGRRIRHSSLVGPIGPVTHAVGRMEETHDVFRCHRHPTPSQWFSTTVRTTPSCRPEQKENRHGEASAPASERFRQTAVHAA
ncbi:universal stress protein [Streptomyces sp. NBC_00654]|uniref:universal stress protein n=1 Tax=Streptomyces sp. NBC_00654 TaxID=2975799 RepID=UPI002B1CE945|nr:universal stress protein [Streptomyces sp. NBC_00654]